MPQAEQPTNRPIDRPTDRPPSEAVSNPLCKIAFEITPVLHRFFACIQHQRVSCRFAKARLGRRCAQEQRRHSFETHQTHLKRQEATRATALSEYRQHLNCIHSLLLLLRTEMITQYCQLLRALIYVHVSERCWANQALQSDAEDDPIYSCRRVIAGQNEWIILINDR